MTIPRDATTDGPAAIAPAQLFGRLAALPEALEPLAKPFYVVALLLIFIPALDFWGTIAPLQLGEIRWRFGSLGIYGGYLLTPLFGSVLAMAMAAMMEHRRVQFAVAVLNLGIAIVTLAAIALFMLDALQIRSELGASSVGPFDLVVVRTSGKMFIVMATFLWLAVAGLRSYRKTRVPEGWQPGDPVPIVNSESTNIEGLVVEANPQSERASREMLIAPDAAGIPALDQPRGEALRRDMLLTPSSIPSIGNAPVDPRKSDGTRPDLLVNTDTVRVDTTTVVPKRVTKDMLIVGGDEPEKK